MSVKIRVDVQSNAKQAVDKVVGSVRKLAEKNKEHSKQIKKDWKEVAAAVGVAVIAFNKIKQFFDGLINKYEKQIIAETKLEGALRATGSAAGYSYEELVKMADALKDVTIYADEALIEAQALLLTFTQIGKKTFPDALEAAADMSTMFGQDLKQSVIQLGTALNDPIAGVGRLKRIGISFTEEQRNMIRGFVEANDVMAAQAVILEEIQVEFGGVARAMGESAIGKLKQLNNQWTDMQEKAGEALLEGLLPLMDAFEDFITFLEANVDIFKEIGAAIAFIGSIIINAIKFFLQFKEAIIAYLIVANAIPAAMAIAAAAVKAFELATSGGWIALLIAGIVGVIAAIAGIVGAAQKAEREFQNLKKETNELAEGLLLEAATGAIKNLGGLQAALSQTQIKMDELTEAAIKGNKKQFEDLAKLIDRYIDLERQIEKQIEIRKEIELLEDATAQNLTVYDQYVDALIIVNKKLQEYENAIAQIVKIRKAEAAITGEPYEPPDVSELQKSVNYWKNLQTEIAKTAFEVKNYGADFKEVMEQRAAIEEDFTEKFFKLSNSRVEILKKERAETIAEAEEVGANTYNIWAYYNELIRKEAEKTNNDRIKFEEDYLKKFEELTLTGLEILERDKKAAIEIAKDKGANELVVIQYYDELIRINKEEENEKQIIAEKEMLAELEAEYQKHAEDRKRLQEDVTNYIIGLSNKWLLSESELLQKQKEGEISRVEGVAQRWREEIGYIVDAAGDIKLDMEIPEDWASAILEIQYTQEEINAYTDEYNKKLKEAELSEIKIGQAKGAISAEYLVQINEALKLERLAAVIGETYFDNYANMLKITQEMKTQEQVQSASIKNQINDLQQLISSTETQMSLAGISGDDFIESLPYRQIISQANQAIVFLQEELAKIPTEAGKAFLELTTKVGVISQKYIDPLEKKKKILVEELRQVTEYLAALRAKQQLQNEHLKTLDLGSEIWASEYLALTEMSGMIDNIDTLTKDINDQIADVNTEIAEGDAGEQIDFTAMAMSGLASVTVWLTDQFIQLITSTESFQKYMEDFGILMSQIMEQAVFPLLEAFQPIIIVLLEVATIVITLIVPVFKMFGVLTANLLPLFVSLGNLIIKIVGIFQALAPVVFIIADMLGTILVPIIDAVSGVFGFLGDIVGALAPIFDALGYVTDAVSRVFQTLFVIVDFISGPIAALGEMIYYIISFQWDKIGGIQVMTPADLVDELSSIWSQSWVGNEYQDFAIDPTTIPELALSIDDVHALDAQDFGATIYGGNVSVQQAPDIYIYQTFLGNIIGAGGMVEVGEFVTDAIHEYVGAGGKTAFNEGGE